MKNTKIEWADHTINFWWGCTKVSAGCANCYAEGLDKRWHGGEHWGKGAPRRPRLEAARKEALALNRKAEREGRQYRIFANSMNDWLDPEVPIQWLAEMLETIRITPNLTWMLLTKRPELWLHRMKELIKTCEFSDNGWLKNWIRHTPPSNVWIGASVENQAAADERIPHLLKIPSKVRFLSCEPLLGAVSLPYVDFPKAWEIAKSVPDGRHHEKCSYRTQRGGLLCDCDILYGVNPLEGIHWVIAGGESGPDARPMHPDWARSLRDQCQAAGVPFFMKQMGGTKKPFMEIPNDLMIREFPEVDHG